MWFIIGMGICGAIGGIIGAFIMIWLINAAIKHAIGSGLGW